MADAWEKSGLGSVPSESDQSYALVPVLRQYAMLSSVVVMLVLMVGFHYTYRGFHRDPVEVGYGHHVPAAAPGRGPELVRAYGCGGCHTIPGVAGAVGKVGPRLDRVAEQAFVAGVLPNSPQHLADWIRRPRDHDPRTAMPDLGVTETDARDLAAYLYAQQ